MWSGQFYTQLAISSLASSEPFLTQNSSRDLGSGKSVTGGNYWIYGYCSRIEMEAA